jgi:MFS family permease
VLLVANIASVVIYFPIGALADRYGRKPILYVIGLIGLAGSLLYFPLLNTRSWLPILLATLLLLGAANVRGGASTVLMAESFPTPIRNTGYNTIYTVSVLIGSPTPFVCAALVEWTGTPWSIAAVLAAATILSLAVLPFIHETIHVNLEDAHA